MSSLTKASVPTVPAAHSVPASGLAEALTLRLLVPVATMLTIGAVALVLLLTPFWLHPALDAADSAAWLGMSPQAARDYSDRTVNDLVFASGDFDFVAPDGTTFFDASERAHMRDVRVVLYGFLGLSAIAAIFLGVVTYRRRADVVLRRRPHRSNALPGGGWWS